MSRIQTPRKQLLRPLTRLFGLLLLTGLSIGCTATKSTVHLVQAEQALLVAKEAEAPTYAPYTWTLAEQFMLKAREEWARSDFGKSEELAMRTIELSEEATQQAANAPRDADAPAQDALPEATSAPAEDALPETTSQPPAADNPWPDGNVTEGDAPDSDTRGGDQ